MPFSFARTTRTSARAASRCPACSSKLWSNFLTSRRNLASWLGIHCLTSNSEGAWEYARSGSKDQLLHENVDGRMRQIGRHAISIVAGGSRRACQPTQRETMDIAAENDGLPCRRRKEDRDGLSEVMR